MTLPVSQTARKPVAPPIGRKRTRAERLRRTIAGSLSGTLAYTCLCLVTLIYAVCIAKMPDQILAKVHALFG